ncbi:MAG TPA: ABC transporter permease [Gemmatimonadales bacterium]|nr:ABC transporter permease [Gemmatimonadales bacterium]
MIASLSIALGTLRANPLRTVLSTLGIVIGAAALVAVLTLGDGMERFGRQQLATTTDLQSVVLEPRTVEIIDNQAYPLERYLVLTRSDAEAILAAIPHVTAGLLTLIGSAPFESTEGAADSVQVVATLPTQAAVLKWGFAAGRYFTADEAGDSAAVAVLSGGLGGRVGNGDPAAAVGRSVRIRGREFQVVGVLESRGAERIPSAFVPLELAGQVLAPTPRPRAPTLVLQAERVEEVKAVREGVEGWLAGKLGPGWERMARVHTNAQRVVQAERAILVFKLFLGAITGISLLVGGIGIMNVLLASVMERTREIGVRKAIGARRRDLLAQFLLESVTIAGLGSILGTLLGLGGAYGVTAFMRTQLDAPVYAALSWGTLGVSAAAAILVGVAFGIYPALRAARLSPIEAIRHE